MVYCLAADYENNTSVKKKQKFLLASTAGYCRTNSKKENRLINAQICHLHFDEK